MMDQLVQGHCVSEKAGEGAGAEQEEKGGTGRGQ